LFVWWALLNIVLDMWMRALYLEGVLFMAEVVDADIGRITKAISGCAR